MANINFYNVDCVQFMKTIPDKHYDLAWCDTPYGIGEDGGKNHTRGKAFGGKKSKSKGVCKAKDYKAYAGNDKSAPGSEYWNELRRISKNQIVWGANHFISKIPYDTSCWIVWDKMNGYSDFADCELAWTSYKSAVRIFRWKWNGMLQQNMKNKQDRIHPNEKPIELMRWCLNKYAKQGDKIFSSHGGSMKDAIACDIEGFDLDICELDKHYFDLGVKAFNLHKSQTRIF